MCRYYYMHHHHLDGCSRPIDFAVHYEFCERASKGEGDESRIPCDRAYYDPLQSVDHDNPCATGGCLVSPDCTSGACRLEELKGRWACCKCGRGANTLRWCRHKMKKCPDTFCYHQVCATCTPDADEDSATVLMGP